MWNKHEFNYTKIVEGKGFILTEGEYKHGETEQLIPVVIINV